MVFADSHEKSGDAEKSKSQEPDSGWRVYPIGLGQIYGKIQVVGTAQLQENSMVCASCLKKVVKCVGSDVGAGGGREL